MFSTRAIGPVCLFCELRATLSSFRSGNNSPAWQSSRSASQLQRKRPQRMILSPTVARPPTAARPPSKTVLQVRTPKKEDRTSPFGAMNRTAAPADLEEQRRKRLARSAGRAPRTTTSPKERSSNSKKRRDGGDMRALKMQQALSSVPYGQRTAIKSRLSEVDSFNEFPLLAPIRQALNEDVLRGLADISPTPIQRLAIPALLGTNKKRRAANNDTTGMQQYLLAAETGSGKTLAYTLPVLDAIKRAESAEAEAEAEENAAKVERRKHKVFELEPPPLSDDPHSTSGRPRAIILLPTSELVDQVGAVIKRFSHTVKLRVSLISSQYSAAIIRSRLFGPNGIDVLVATPHLVGSIAQSDPNILSRVTHLVIDEADSLLDRSFAPTTSAVLDRAAPSLKQLILCSATIPRSLDSYLEKRFPNIVRLATPNLHAIPRRVQLSVVDIEQDPYKGSRDLACADAIYNIGREAPDSGDDSQSSSAIKRILVFVNEREEAPKLASYLVSKGIDAVALNRDMAEQRRGDVLAAFTSTEPIGNAALDLPKSKNMINSNATVTTGIPNLDHPRSASTSTRRAAFATSLTTAANPQAKSSSSRRILPNTKVLVMTDIGARGIDTVAVRTVILYDVPYTSIDFIHRLGRTGRMGRRGRGIVLVGNGDRKDVVREIREGMFRGQALI